MSCTWHIHPSHVRAFSGFRGFRCCRCRCWFAAWRRRSPRPIGTADDRYKHVDAAIAVIQASGLKYEVHAMGTVVEGPPEQIWPLLQAVHEATLQAGAERTLSIIKVSGSSQAGGPRVEDLVRKFRK
jgi:uncharacterized protein YqgV (UPF0045/DUF77 family)